ncbi:hypothetical protein JCM3774_005954 [Rhodotorula dairenensis]
MASHAPPVSVSLPTGPSADGEQAAMIDLDERLALALRLVDAVLEHDDALVRKLVELERADCWVQDRQGWTALHAAAYTGNVEHVNLLLRKGNAVWALTDNLGCTAGDIAFSMNNSDAYEALLAEGVRAEMLRAVLEATTAHDDDDDDEEEVEEEEGPVASTSGTTQREDADMLVDQPEGQVGPKQKEQEPELSTASDNATFLASRLVFTHDAAGQPVALDAEGNGVMMGWESGIMRRTADALCEPAWGDRRYNSAQSEDPDPAARWERLRAEEERGEREPLRVMNVGFGLGIIDSFLQEYVPTAHLIVEPHPDVLAFARRNGWYDRRGVRFYEGTWKQYLRDLELGKEEYVGFDVVYFDTYSEHYSDLHEFFSAVPDLLSISDAARFSFFHGLGATSRLLYDVYTTVSELHLREIGLETRWDEVDVVGGDQQAVSRWTLTGAAVDDGEKKYWREEMCGRYRLPICKLGV